jgi:hypothetical protein
MLWEMVAGLSNDYRALGTVGVALGGRGNIFIMNGKPIKWETPPKVLAHVEPRRKRQKPRADIESITWGAIILNDRADKVLRDYLQPFGEFLLLDCEGESLHFYNVTALYSVIDQANSVQNGLVNNKPCFLEKNIPQGFCIFKDELTAHLAIYLNEETKLTLEKLLNEHKLTGLIFGPAGSF